MRIAYVLYPGFTALDLNGPYAIISRWPTPTSASWRDRSIRFAATAG